MSYPLVSVIMPVRNAEQFVGQAIESILGQSFKDFEFIIVDDGSTDNTLGIIKSYNDHRIKLFESVNKGVSRQSNFAVSHACGKYISKMDGDDISHKNRLAEHFNFLENNSSIQLVGNNIQLIDSTDNKIGVIKYPESNSDINYFLPVRPTVFNGTITMRKDVFDKLEGYNDNFEVGEDHEFLMRYCSSGLMSYNIQKVLYYYRIYQRQVNVERERKQNRVSYSLGRNILQKEKEDGVIDEYDFCYKMGLIEYYRGSLHGSNRYFLAALRLRWTKFFKLFRYLLVSSVLHKPVESFRKRGTAKRINKFFNKYLAIDLHSLKR